MTTVEEQYKTQITKLEDQQKAKIANLEGQLKSHRISMEQIENLKKSILELNSNVEAYKKKYEELKSVHNQTPSSNIDDKAEINQLRENLKRVEAELVNDRNSIEMLKNDIGSKVSTVEILEQEEKRREDIAKSIEKEVCQILQQITKLPEI